MSVGFRKGLFGFNCDDVMQYIEKTHKEFAEKEILLNEKVDGLNETLESLNAQLEEIKEAKRAVERELQQYTDKYEEIERLSQNIGKLYLVAQSNADSIMKNAEESADKSRKEIERNLYSIDAAHESFNEMKLNVMKTSADFVSRVESLMDSLGATRDLINKNSGESAVKAQEFEALCAEISK